VLVAVRWHPLVSLDRHADVSATGLLQSHHWLETASRRVTQFGDPRFVDLLALAGAAAAATRRRWDLVILLVAVRLLELGVNTLIKDLVDRPRPTLAHPIVHAAGNSFPSGHAAGTAAVFGALAILFLTPGARVMNRVIVAVAALLVVCVATTRVLLGVHYPSDVAGGILVGVAMLALVRTALPAR
jgi:membrane-associated phospholipid phosphatase